MSTESHIDPASKWGVYESNVQAYRGLSLSSQSLYLAVGAILLEGELRAPLVIMFVVAMATAWLIWFPVIFARTAIVDFHKHNLAEHVNVKGGRLDKDAEPGSDAATPLRERDYARVGNRSLRRSVYASVQPEIPEIPNFRTMRQSRMKIDGWMPVLITIVWIAFLIHGLALR